jgi:uncharacterized membrane protein (DUF485 family)
LAPDSTGSTTAFRTAAASRWRVALALTLAMIAMYFGFIALIAYRRDLLAIRLTEGLTLGIVLGASVIVISWLLTWVYIHWANTHYDTAMDAAERRP